MIELYHKNQLKERNHTLAHLRYRKWLPYRNVVNLIRSIANSSRLTSWAGSWLPVIPASGEFRYKSDLDLDDDRPGRTNATWFEWAISLMRNPLVHPTTQTSPAAAAGTPPPLTKQNVVAVFREALEAVKVRFFSESPTGDLALVFCTPPHLLMSI